MIEIKGYQHLKLKDYEEITEQRILIERKLEEAKANAKKLREKLQGSGHRGNTQDDSGTPGIP